MTEHPIQGLMKTAMESIQQMIDVNTIVGDPVETPDGSVIMTVSKVGFGFGAGGTEFFGDIFEDITHQTSTTSPKATNGKFPFGGGSGGGVSITPVAFLVVNQDGVKILHLDESTHLYEKILELAPTAMEKIQDLFKKKEEKEDIDVSITVEREDDLYDERQTRKGTYPKDDTYMD